MTNFKYLFLISLFTVILVACGNGEQEAESETSEETPAEETAEEETEAETSDTEVREEEAEESDDSTAQSETDEETVAAETALDIEREYHEIGDPPRELTELEEEMLQYPGEFSDENFDVDAVTAELDTMDPEAASDEWGEAILNLIQESYYEEVEQTVRFDASIDVDAEAPEESEEHISPGTSHFSILLDASASMEETSDVDTRMTEAKEAIETFTAELPENSTISLRVYGHEEPVDQEASCESTEVIYQGAPDMSAVQNSMSSVEPVGWTPLATAIEESINDVPEDATDTIVYVVSDGIETCGEDPVSAASDLVAMDVEPIINIIGFEVADEEQQDLIDIAETGGGEFTYVDSGAELTLYWEEENQRMMDAWTEWTDEAMEQVDDQTYDLMAEADETGEEIMEASDREFNNAVEVLNKMADEEIIDSEYHNELFNFFDSRARDIWDYGYETSTENWSASFDLNREAWDEIYEQGTEKWTEYYNR